MKFYKLFVCFIMCSIVGYTQIPGSKSFKPIITKSGNVIKVGDTLTIGLGSKYNGDYKFIYVPSGIVSTKSNFKADESGNKTIIKHFKIRKIGGEEIVYAVIPPGKTISSFNNAAIELENALYSGEVLTKDSQYFKSMKNIVFNNNEVPLLYYIKVLGDDPSEYCKEFLSRFDENKYEKGRQDEFEFYEIQKAEIPKLQTKIDELNNEDIYTLTVKHKLGEYSFENNAFELRFTHDYFTVLRRSPYKDRNTEVNITFSNSDQVTYFPIDRLRAKEFIASRKNKYNGKVDRTVYLRINFTMTDDLKDIQDSVGIKKNCLVGVIKSIDVYGNKNFLSNELGILKL